MRILTLDVGNTSIDACLFEGREIKYLGKFKHSEVESLRGDYDKVYISSVKPSLEEVLREVFKEPHFITWEEVPIRASFDIKNTGIDRLLNVYGAISFYGENVLVVSCGTALVLDLVLRGIYEGGFISLGLSGKLRCLTERAELIPPLELEKVSVSVGKDTKGAILGGILKEAKSFVRAILTEFNIPTVVITGGDGYLLEDVGLYDPLLIHKAIIRLFRHM